MFSKDFLRAYWFTKFNEGIKISISELQTRREKLVYQSQRPQLTEVRIIMAGVQIL